MKWEYKRVQLFSVDFEAHERKMSELGTDGWEIVSVYKDSSTVVWLKRPMSTTYEDILTFLRGLPDV